MEEIWKNIKGYEGLYQVSNLGRVRSLDRIVTFSDDRRRFYEGKILIQTPDRDGYLLVKLHGNGKPVAGKVHRLECIEFLDNPDNKDTINHKDGIKSNNELSNLEWATQSENQKHAFNTGLKKAPLSMLGRFGKDNPGSVPVVQLTPDGSFVREFEGMRHAQRETGINRGNISNVTLKKCNHAGGFKWVLKKEYYDSK